MDISAIMVHVDTSRHALVRLSHAAALADAFRATLIGLLSAEPGYTAPSPDHDATRRVFESAMERASFAVDWRIGEGSAVDALHCEGRLADLIVLSQPDQVVGRADAAMRFVEAAIVDTGPPVLIIPPGPTLNSNRWPYALAVVAWSGSRESARALRDALPVLKRASQVEIICCAPLEADREQGVSPPSYALAWLARRGIRAALTQLLRKPYVNAGEAVLEAATRRRADLLVCGAHGHCRQGTRATGSVTDTVLTHSPIPVLFAC
nr:universal stress protein [uncultured Cupriavidus sp.]